MIILLTPAMLATDIVTAACYKMAAKLRLPVKNITAKWVPNDKGGLGVEFSVDVENGGIGISDELIRAAVQTVWAYEYKRKLEWTLENVKSVRR